MPATDSAVLAFATRTPAVASRDDVVFAAAEIDAFDNATFAGRCAGRLAGWLFRATDGAAAGVCRTLGLNVFRIEAALFVAAFPT